MQRCLLAVLTRHVHQMHVKKISSSFLQKGCGNAEPKDFGGRGYWYWCGRDRMVAASNARGADPDSITVKVDEPGAKFSPLFYGLMTEEINHAYDGGSVRRADSESHFPRSRGRRRGAAQSRPGQSTALVGA